MPLSEQGKPGRPSIFSEELGDEICRRIAEGESLRSICRDEDMPDKATVLRWLLHKVSAHFCDQYAYARDIQLDGYADEIPDIADDGSNDFYEKETKSGGVIQCVDHEHVQRSKLRVDARLALMERLKPKKYGKQQRLEHSSPDGGPLQVMVTHKILDPVREDD